MTDLRMMFLLFVILLFAIFSDDGAAQRWCDTYQFCDGEMEIKNHE